MATRVKGYGLTGFAATGASGTATTAAGTKGDVHIAQVDIFAQGDTVTGPPGWFQLPITKHLGGAQYQVTYWAWVDDGTTTSFTWNWTTVCDRGIWVEVLRGADPVTPLAAFSLNQGTSATATNPGISNAPAGALIAFINNDNGFVGTALGGSWATENNTLDQFISDTVPFGGGAVGSISSAIVGGSTDWVADILAIQDARPRDTARPILWKLLGTKLLLLRPQPTMPPAQIGYLDTASGTVPVSGTTAAEQKIGNDSQTGSIPLSGTRSDARIATDAASGSITVTGGRTELARFTDATVGTIPVTGTSTEIFTGPTLPPPPVEPAQQRTTYTFRAGRGFRRGR